MCGEKQAYRDPRAEEIIIKKRKEAKQADRTYNDLLEESFRWFQGKRGHFHFSLFILKEISICGDNPQGK
jgi:hypothetical protein